MIDKFRGEYSFLSNFYDAPVEYKGVKYLNSEAAFQAQKAIDVSDRLQFVSLDASNAKRLGRVIPLRPDWDEIKDNIMYEICYAKFTQNPDLREKLLATGNKILIEGNNWNDCYWGKCNDYGLNRLGDILMQIRRELSFDAPKVKSEIIAWIRNFFSYNGNNCNAVIGISGGKDSSIVAALCVEALGKDRVIGVLMPNGTQSDIQDSQKLVEHLGIENYVINIGNVVNNLLEQIEYSTDYEGFTNKLSLSEQTKINLPCRIRMTTLYGVSQSRHGRVANTCNLSEDYIGYSTRWGDSVGDFSPLANLTTDEVMAVGIECGLPKELVYKTPADGLCGKTDEDNLGFSYRTLNHYIRTGVCYDEEAKRKIDAAHQKNLFKLRPIPSFPYIGGINDNC